MIIHEGEAGLTQAGKVFWSELFTGFPLSSVSRLLTVVKRTSRDAPGAAVMYSGRTFLEQESDNSLLINVIDEQTGSSVKAPVLVALFAGDIVIAHDDGAG